MSYENLKLRALLVRDYLIKCQAMAMFAGIRDIRDKEVWHLKKLRAMGINGLTIGTESGTVTRLPWRAKDMRRLTCWSSAGKNLKSLG